jgi:hypothetical protein
VKFNEGVRQMVLRQWLTKLLPRKVVACVSHVYEEYRISTNCTELRVKFKNGVISPSITCTSDEELSKSNTRNVLQYMVQFEPSRQKELDYFVAWCLMAYGESDGADS